VELTPAGHALVERSVDTVLGREAALVSSLSDEERAALVAVLDKLTTDVRRRTARQDD
jgi:DNA-binding MarR family transcriptional regulator